METLGLRVQMKVVRLPLFILGRVELYRHPTGQIIGVSGCIGYSWSHFGVD